MPDPILSVWEKEDKRLLKKGLAKKDRPPKPQRNPEYPTNSDRHHTLHTKNALNYLISN